MPSNETKFWMVWCEGTRTVSYKHETQDEAEQEAQRLALAEPGKRFYVLLAIKACQREQPVTWVDLAEDVPF